MIKTIINWADSHSGTITLISILVTIGAAAVGFFSRSQIVVMTVVIVSLLMVVALTIGLIQLSREESGKGEAYNHNNILKYMRRLILFGIVIVFAAVVGFTFYHISYNYFAEKQHISDNNDTTIKLSSEQGEGWGDSSGGRRSYSSAEVEEGVIDDDVIFNSIFDGLIGNEKNFVGAIKEGSDTDNWQADSISVEDGEKYTVCLFVHNDNPNGNEAIAEDVKVAFDLPLEVSKSHTVTGIIQSSNSLIEEYWDTVSFTSDEFFYLEYVDGSARYTNNKMGCMPIGDDVITGGVPIGYDRFDGNVPGGYDYSGFVTIDVIAHKSVKAELSVEARLKGTKQWEEAVYANIGDEIEFQIEFQNLVDNRVNDVMIRDSLPNNMEYIRGSTILYNSSHQEGLQISEDTIITSGINIGDYRQNGNAFIRFTARIVDKSLADGKTQLINWAKVTIWSGDNEGYVYQDDASAFVNK